MLLIAITLAAGPALGQDTPHPVRAATRMAADAHPSFAVAAITPHDPSVPGSYFDTKGQRFTIRNKSVADMMRFAYAVHPRQIEGPLDLAFHDRYDVIGIADAEGEPNLSQQQEMIQELLTDRFKLKFHREKREMPVYAIEVAKGGSKLRPTADPVGRADWRTIRNAATDRTDAFTNASIGVFILASQFSFDRPLVDHTGLTGRYDFYLRFNPDETNTFDPNAPPGIFTAAQEQLGLRFQPTKAPVDVLIIDHVEKPTEN